MCHANDILVAIPRPDWPALRDLYRRDWPLHFVGFQTIDALISWTKLHPAIGHLQVYALNGDWSDGTFVVAVSEYIIDVSIGIKIHTVNFCLVPLSPANQHAKPFHWSPDQSCRPDELEPWPMRQHVPVSTPRCRGQFENIASANQLCIRNSTTIVLYPARKSRCSGSDVRWTPYPVKRIA